jgi:hypothetical protein
MAKLADAADLKSAGAKALWGFDSPSRHQVQRIRYPPAIQSLERNADGQPLREALVKDMLSARIEFVKH